MAGKNVIRQLQKIDAEWESNRRCLSPKSFALPLSHQADVQGPAKQTLFSFVFCVHVEAGDGVPGPVVEVGELG